MISFKIVAVDDESGDDIAVLERAIGVEMPLNMTAAKKAEFLDMFLEAIRNTMNTFIDEAEEAIDA